MIRKGNIKIQDVILFFSFEIIIQFEKRVPYISYDIPSKSFLQFHLLYALLYSSSQLLLTSFCVPSIRQNVFKTQVHHSFIFLKNPRDPKRNLGVFV